MSAHYFSDNELSESQHLTRVKIFLNQLLASDTVIKKVSPQFDSLSNSSFKQAVRFDGLGDLHQLIIKPSTKPIYKLDIQYDWIPAEF